MAEFGLTEAHEMFRSSVREFVKKELAPGGPQRAKLEFIPLDVLKKIGDMGLLGIGLPEEYGGQPGDWVSRGIAAEELARGNFVEGNLMTYPSLFHAALQRSDAEIRREWLPAVIKGERVVSFGNTEPGCGSDAAAIQSKAVRKGDNYLIRGEKTVVTMGMQSEAMYTTAKTGPSKGSRGVSAFLVPMNFPGVSRFRLPSTGCKGYGAASVIMEDVVIPEKYRLGQEGEGFHLIMNFFDYARVILSLCCVGAASVSLEETIAYAKQRTAFGHPIARWEGVSFQIAECATLIDAARMMCFRSLWLRDCGMPHAKETAMAKWFVPRACARIVHDCILIMGHPGYSEENPLEQRLRDILGHEIADGTAQIQKLIIARELLGREFLPY